MHDPKKDFVEFLKQQHQLGKKVETSALYQCSVCKNLNAFKRGEKFAICKECPHPTQRQTWHQTEDLIHFVSRNLNVEYERDETLSLKAANWIADFVGDIRFAYFHVVWFILWVLINTGDGILGISQFDPYPFLFLVMVVSLEAIFLVTFILISQNIQSQRSELHADIDYKVNLKTEKDVAEMLAILNDIREGKLQIKGKHICLDCGQKKND